MVCNGKERAANVHPQSKASESRGSGALFFVRIGLAGDSANGAAAS